jgi:glycosyltransferase involved in cell wall biosynthesis
MLHETLASLERIHRPSDLPAEVVVIDNASTDTTREVATSWRLPGLPARYAREERPGVAHARNAALAIAAGRVILFLDDDVRPPPGWLAAMSDPILSGAADGVAGGVRLADHLRRPWMEPLHLAWLAATDYLARDAPQEMVSANMALGRHVLTRVPAFDPELGPGALGQGEDSLFSWQLLRAGFRIASALDVVVEHHFDPARLLRASFRATAERRGRTLAYQRHHWEHVELPDARRRLVHAWLRSLVHLRVHQPREGMAAREMLAREEVAFLREWPATSRRPRNYDRFGLVKRTT